MEAQQIVQALIARRMTQAEIAELTGIPQPTLSKILRGKVEDVMSRSYRKLAALLADRQSADQQTAG